MAKQKGRSRVRFQIMKPRSQTKGWVDRWIYSGSMSWWDGSRWVKDRTAAQIYVGFAKGWEAINALPEPGPRTTYCLVYADRRKQLQGVEIDTERIC